MYNIVNSKSKHHFILHLAIPQKENTSLKSKKPLLITIFIVYCAAVAYVTLARSASAVFDTFGMLGTDGFMSYHELLSANLNLIPFFSFYNFIAMPVKTGIVVRGFFVNLFGNLLLFLPWGLLLPCISEKMRSAKRFFRGDLGGHYLH